MLGVLVANQDKAEGAAWRSQVSKRGFTALPECDSLSEMVYLLTREKVHIVLCAANLIDNEALLTLKATDIFFPRVKLIIVGGDLRISPILSSITRVTLIKSVDSALKNCMTAIPPEAVSDSEEIREQTLRFLLGNHFMPSEDAAVLLSRSFLWEPGYVIFNIAVDAYREETLKALKKAATELKITYVLPYDRDSFCLILDKSPSKEQAVSIANELRLSLLKETNAMFSIGISRMRMKTGDLAVCRKEAARACNATHVFGYNSVIHADCLGTSDIEYAYPKHKEQRLIEATMDGDTETATKMLDEIFEVFKARKDLKQGLINKIILGVIVGLNIAATSRANSLEKMNIDSLALSKLMAVKSVDEAYAYLRKGIFDFASEMDAITAVSQDALFYKLKELKSAGGGYVSDFAESLDTTKAFIAAAIRRNDGGDVFDYFDCEV
ncbi:MAG: hypothetical protein FWG87_06655 [Defluviitaleaceae bacterium]|nr:hypothetical protein [Defluviitaleaceae bacterium]